MTEFNLGEMFLSRRSLIKATLAGCFAFADASRSSCLGRPITDFVNWDEPNRAGIPFLRSIPMYRYARIDGNLRFLENYD